MPELSEIVRRELRVLAENENIEILQTPEYQAEIQIPLLKELAEALAKDNDDGITEFDELYKVLLKDLQEQYTNEKDIREISNSYAKSLYTSREEVKNGFDNILKNMGEDLEPE